MAGRKPKRKNDPQKSFVDAATQTGPDIERDRLQEENSLLRRELEQLKKKQLISTPRRRKEEVTVVAVADSPQAEKNSVKGCTCKGKCSSRVCGCVKKQISCSAACKCEDSKCQNQESDKENIGPQNAEADVSSEAEENIKPLKNRRKQNVQWAAGPSNKQLDGVATPRKGIFSSPDTPKRGQDFPVSKLQLGTPIKFESKEESVETEPELPVKTKVQKNEKSKSERSKKKRLIPPLHDGRKPRTAASEIADIDGVHSPVEKETDELELSTNNPMKPTRELQRTPVAASPRKQSFRLSDVPLPLQPLKVEKRILVPPPKDIDSPQVDWDEHCAQLVPCRLCKRTFYPHRIEKHEASCKKI